MTFMPSVIACATCANNFLHEDTNAAGWSIAVMLFIIVPLVTMVTIFMVRIARRERAGLDPKYCDDYVAPPTPTANS